MFYNRESLAVYIDGADFYAASKRAGVSICYDKLKNTSPNTGVYLAFTSMQLFPPKKHRPTLVLNHSATT